MGPSDIREAESVEYIRDVLGEGDRLEWITAAEGFRDDITGSTGFADAIDVYTAIGDGSVTWLWSVGPTSTEQLLSGGEGMRALLHPDGWLVLIDASDPEFIWVEPDLDLYTSGRRTVVLRSGAVPDPAAVGRLGDVPFEARSGLSLDRVSAALSLWCQALLDVAVAVEFRGVGHQESEAIEDLAAATEDGVEDEAVEQADVSELDGALVEAEEIVAERTSMWWMQSELSWLDIAGDPCFAGPLQVHTRESDGSMAWLVEVLPEAAAEDAQGPLASIDCGGWQISVPVDDPYTIFVPFDRLIVTASRRTDAYEADGIGTPIGAAVPAPAWDRIRAAVDSLEDGVLVRTLGWSEERVSESVAAWLLVGTGREAEFWYDADDPMSQQGAIANRNRAQAIPRAQDTSRRRCMYERPDALAFEVGARCPNVHEYHYRVGDDVYFVCSRHVPDGVTATPVMSR